MNAVHRSVLLAALLLCAGAVAAAPDPADAARPKVLPVLVRVDAHGNITSVAPSISLTPKLERLLRANLDEMINAPAIDPSGRAVSCQFIINLALQTSRRPQGDYDLQFAYVSVVPVPAGSYYWVHTDGRRLALAPQGDRGRGQRIPYRYDRPLEWRGRDIHIPAITPPVPTPSPNGTGSSQGG